MELAITKWLEIVGILILDERTTFCDYKIAKKFII